MNRQRLEEIAKQKGKKLLVESFALSEIKKEDIVVFDKVELIESAGNQYKARGILKNVPVTRYTENFNGRIYPKQLWENVSKAQIAEGSLSLADHPEDDGSVKNIAGVWRNFKVMERVGIADWYLVGDLGQLILETVQAGGKIGVSSVGFGQFLEDEKTVDPETYELERLGDAVINPSQSVFATSDNFGRIENTKKEGEEEAEDEEDTIDDITPESDIEDDVDDVDVEDDLDEEDIMGTEDLGFTESTRTSKLREKGTNKDKHKAMTKIAEENTQMLNDKIQIANYKNQVRVAINEAKGKEKISEAIDDLKSVKESVPVELTETHFKLDSAITELTLKMDEQIKNAGNTIKEKEKVVEDLKNKLSIAEATIKDLKDKCSKAAVLVEKVKDINPDDYKTLLENEEAMLSDIERFKEERKALKARIQKLKESSNTKSPEVKKQIKKLQEKLNSKSNLVGRLEKQLKIAERHIKKLENLLEDEYEYEFEDDDKTDSDNDGIFDQYEDVDDVTDKIDGQDDPNFVVDTLEEDDEDVDYFAGDGVDPDEAKGIVTGKEDPFAEDDMDADDGDDTYVFEPNDDASDGLVDDEVNEDVDVDPDNDDDNDIDPSLDDDDDMVEDIVTDDEVAQATMKAKEAIRRKKLAAKQKALKEAAARKKNQASTNNRIKEKIQAYYLAEKSLNPAIKDIKANILNSKSLVEAVAKVEKFKSKGKNVSIKKEGLKANPDWLGNRQ